MVPTGSIPHSVCIALVVAVLHAAQISHSANAFVGLTGSVCRTTSLFANKNKGPRFSQKVHNKGSQKSGGAPSKKKGVKKKAPEPWDSGKSLEDLEAAMVQRWGTHGADINGSLDIEITGGGGGSKKNKKKKPSSGLGLRRAVFDPWENVDKRKAQDDSMTREFYGKDDETFEEVEWDETEGEFNVVVGPGEDDSSPGFFFNPTANEKKPAAIEPPSKRKRQLPPPASPPRKGEIQPSAVAVGEEEVAKPKSRSMIPPAIPILDEDGDPVLLSVDEALSRFQSALVEEDEDSQMAEDSEDWMETPLIASSSVRPSQSWTDLGIHNRIILENLEAMECPTPLAVQDKAIPPAVEGNDVLIGTYTGSGKTLAFLVPLVQRLLDEIEEYELDASRLGLTMLIIAPGRELASQIASVARDVIAGTGLTVQLSIGGTTFARNLEQIRKRKPNILVGTPGRVAELVVGKPGDKSGRLKIAELRALVMDEFDALLEYKPHRDPTQAVMEALRRRHRDNLQSVFCSATASDVADSAKVTEFLRPGYVEAMADQDDKLVTSSGKGGNAPRVSRTVIHGAIHVPHSRMALSTVRRILHTEPFPQQILIFVDNARKVDIVVEKLAAMGIIAAPLHGGAGSDKMDRAEISKALREGFVGVVVATELAARGLDAPLLTHVINMDLPTDASHYAHRAGRCGRGGRPGVVINLTKNIKERKVPLKFANALGIDMNVVEAREGKLMLVNPESVSTN